MDVRKNLISRDTEALPGLSSWVCAPLTYQSSEPLAHGAGVEDRANFVQSQADGLFRLSTGETELVVASHKSLGTPLLSKMDEFLEKLQTAFAAWIGAKQLGSPGAELPRYGSINYPWALMA